MRIQHLILFALLAISYLTTGYSHAAQSSRGVASNKPTSTASYGGSRPSGSATSGDIGLGAMFGEPTGLTLKSWTSRRTAFDVGVAYSFSGFFEILGDYLWHFPGAFANASRGRVSSEFVPYVGIGVEAFFDTEDANAGGRRDSSNAGFGLRLPLGLEFLPTGAPLGVFAEIVPGLGLAPATFGFLEGVVGARFYL